MNYKGKEIKEHPLFAGYYVPRCGSFVVSGWCRSKGARSAYQVNHSALKTLSIWKHKQGYLMVRTKYGHKSVHRLVAETYLPNLDNLPEVNHKDLNKENNAVSNLEWVTGAENVEHARAKVWVVEDIKTGEKFCIYNLKKWCRDNPHYNQAHLCRTYRGGSKYSQHKGLRVVDVQSFS